MTADDFVETDRDYFQEEVWHLWHGYKGGLGDGCMISVLFSDITACIDWRGEGRRTQMKLTADHTHWDQMEFGRSCLLAAGMTWANFYTSSDCTCWRWGGCVLYTDWLSNQFSSLLWKNNIYCRDLQLVSSQSNITWLKLGFAFLCDICGLVYGTVCFSYSIGAAVVTWYTMLPGSCVLPVKTSRNLKWNGETNKTSATANTSDARVELSSGGDLFFSNFWID